MTGQNIVCFAKDWSEAPTSNNHVMMELAKSNRVLWLNSIATRTPNLGSARDVSKIFRKLVGFFAGARQAAPNLWVYTPIVLPFPHGKLAAALNRRILSATVWLLRKRLRMRRFQLWTFLPNTAQYVGALGESVSVYYCVDEWARFSHVDGKQIAVAEEALCRRVDIVFATSRSLVEAKGKFNPNTHLANHGVDHALFADALDPATQVPADLAEMSSPVIGFYGTIEDWVDLDLIAFLAGRRPDWSIAMIGTTRVDVSRLAKLPNVKFLGRKPHEQLPMYCKGLAVGLIPQKINELTRNMNPIKLREYLAAGLPVVATNLPEAAAMAANAAETTPFVRTARNYEEFERLVAEAIASDTPEFRRRRSESMRDQTWESRVRALGEIVMQAEAAKAAKDSRCNN
jgi:glycosyltransferase involved in cell wall biosynthesis